MNESAIITKIEELEDKLSILNQELHRMQDNPGLYVKHLDSIGFQAHARMMSEQTTEICNTIDQLSSLRNQLESLEYTRSLEAKYDYDLPPVDLNEFDF